MLSSMSRFRVSPPARRSPSRRATAARRGAHEHRALLAARALVDRMRQLYRELEQLTGAPIGMHRALNVVGAEPGIQASLLAATLGMQRPAVSQLLKGMATRGWIERRRGELDHRSVEIYLTASGQRMLKVTVGRAVGVLQRAMHALGDDDVARLAEALPRLLQRLPAADSVSRPASARARQLRAARARQALAGAPAALR
jgi:DNA-binding MarR family transcriptional regulator